MAKISIIVTHHPSRKKPFKRFLSSLKKYASEFDYELLTSSEGSKSACRNALAQRAKGSVLLFFDDDVVLQEHTVRQLLRPFGMYQNVGVVGGVNLTLPDATFMERISGKILSYPFATFRSSSRYVMKGDIRESDEAELQSCVMAISKRAFTEAGGFPEDIIPCEENVLLNAIEKRGFKIIYTPYAVVYHRRSPMFLPYMRTMFDYGKGRGIMIRKHGYSGRPRMIWGLSWETAFLFCGLVAHYVSYISGFVWGIIRGR